MGRQVGTEPFVSQTSESLGRDWSSWKWGTGSGLVGRCGRRTAEVTTTRSEREYLDVNLLEVRVRRP
jgi:hypothetical protein